MMHIKLEGVGMRYRDSSPILEGISLEIPHGRRVALIGLSGAGKSTIASLIRRDFDPSEGIICIDGIPLQNYNLSSVLAHIGVILQTPEIMSSNVRENILLGMRPDIASKVRDEQIWEIIDLVSPEMRKRFNGHGLDTRVGNHGIQLSGGEKQRLCVMRALIKNPELLIVDEATSSLDSETEIAVQKGIDEALARGISALVIAHRLSTLRNCDCFIVLRKLSECKEGESQIEATCGSFPELYEVSPTFRRLADLQEFRM